MKEISNFGKAGLFEFNDDCKDEFSGFFDVNGDEHEKMELEFPNPHSMYLYTMYYTNQSVKAIKTLNGQLLFEDEYTTRKYIENTENRELFNKSIIENSIRLILKFEVDISNCFDFLNSSDMHNLNAFYGNGIKLKQFNKSISDNDLKSRYYKLHNIKIERLINKSNCTLKPRSRIETGNRIYYRIIDSSCVNLNTIKSIKI